MRGVPQQKPCPEVVTRGRERVFYRSWKRSPEEVLRTGSELERVGERRAEEVLAVPSLLIYHDLPDVEALCELCVYYSTSLASLQKNSL